MPENEGQWWEIEVENLTTDDQGKYDGVKGGWCKRADRVDSVRSHIDQNSIGAVNSVNHGAMFSLRKESGREFVNG